MIDPALVPGDGEAMLVYPHTGGGRDWIPVLQPGDQDSLLAIGRDVHGSNATGSQIEIVHSKFRPAWTHRDVIIPATRYQF